MKSYLPLGVAVALAFFLRAPAVQSQSTPAFDGEFWEGQRAAATGKIRRGAGLAVLGAISAVPSAILIARTTENPERFAGWAAAMGLATVGMTGHGVGSVGFGAKQRRRAEGFVRDHEGSAGDLRVQEEAWLRDQRKTSVKLALFGSFLILESAALLTHGSVLAGMKSRGDDLGGAVLWPYFAVGGALLPVGVLIVVRSVARYREYESEGGGEEPALRAVSVSPWLGSSRVNGGSVAGLVAAFSF